MRCYGVKGQAGTEASGTSKLNSSRGVAWVWRIHSHVVLWQRACAGAGAGEVGTFGGNNQSPAKPASTAVYGSTVVLAAAIHLAAWRLLDL